MNEQLTPSQLRFLTLKSQGLIEPHTFGEGKDATLRAIERLGYLQIDTLSVVERAHHHTLWTRIPDYKPQYLNELVQERQIFEYWFHAASYLPVRDFRYALPQMQQMKQGETHYFKADKKVMQYVLDTIRAEGAKQAKDFESQSKQSGSWWNWKPTKIALEQLFLQGDLMISERSGMQKIYDIKERVLPTNINLTPPTPIEFAEYLVNTYLKAYGFTTLKQITHLKKDKALKDNVNRVLQSLLEDKHIQQINIDGLLPIFIPSALMDDFHSYDKITDSSDVTPNPKIKIPRKTSEDSTSSTASEFDEGGLFFGKGMKILSPFDNLIIHRDRVEQIFGFDYRIECYTPKEKRQYGYFCLPILFGDTFIGRVDCKAHRKEKRLELIHLHIENKTLDIELWLTPFMDLIERFADFNDCQYITFTQISPSKFNKPILRIAKQSKKYKD